MKKIFILTVMVICLVFSVFNVYAEVDVNAKPLVFKPDTSGKYIYCNNHEFIRREDLSDTSREFPTYIMNNECTPDKYAMFVSHVNHTELRDKDNNITEIGFDIEVDVEFKAQTDCTVLISSAGFEVPEHSMYYYYTQQYTREEAWGCMNAWASYLNIPIRELDSGTEYTPRKFTPVTVELKAGESFWLSKYIDNYSAVPFYRPVHLLSNFEIKGGNALVNVAALKSNGTIGDRRHHSKNAAYGRYVRDRQYKGVANSLNKVDTYLNYTISDWVGGKLPVTVYNDYAPNGNTITDWFTHLNPSADPWNKVNAAGSDMLEFEYKDPYKLQCYGSKVKDDQKDDVWKFDTKHSDYAEYPGRKSGYSTVGYIPNAPITDTNADDSACNLGNYGVSVCYHVSIKNEGKITRYVNYNLKTIANNIVILRDKDGNMINPYALCKGENSDYETDTMACVELPAETTTEFIIEVILPTNYVGGMKNSLEVVNTKQLTRVYDNVLQKVPRDYSFTGREFIKWDNGKLYKSYDKENWINVPINAQTEAIFHHNWNEYEILYTDNGYMVKSHLYDSTPYYGIREFFKHVYFLDNDFNLKSTVEFYQYPTQMSYAKGKYYVTAGTDYVSSDGVNWEMIPSANDLPCWNYGRFSALMKDGTVYISEDGTDYKPVLNADFKPYFIRALGDIYYSIRGTRLYVSGDCISWESFDCGASVSELERIGNTIVVNKKIKFDYTPQNSEFILNGGEYIALPDVMGMYNGEKFYSADDLEKTYKTNITWNDGFADINGKKIDFSQMCVLSGKLCVTNSFFESLIK